ncbi:disintegrin and metalloproteinase domain-containing protein 10-like [Orbicella faveolata]|uniref:disintegrin and metalloproteinase domain-containing protein 10-like n=1 Tax=Orbicella faveolata TaxID=48498 RepID=UPI0009E29DB6|nr:disintegrin and metalloproteinase domain-containing protein 10-like [Orbicella faveolata]
MAYHVAMTDKAFRATDFNQDGGPGDDIGFVIAAVTVFKDAESEGSLESPQNIGSLDYLIKWSELDHSAYCLSLLFTYRDFSGGVLGIAWVAQPEPRVLGGICSPRVFLQERGQLMSFNTALATFLNFGRRVPRKVSTITVMHEFGHNFGSGHDPDTCKCSPGGSDGNFVMYSRASDGHEPNNFLFSPCSKQEISPVISSKGQECFIAHSSGSYCGNKIVEEGEDCDCGRPEECLEVDKCCVARDDALNIPGCTVKQGEQCSSVAGECCTEQCTPKSKARVCRAETECSLETTCDGMSGRCPEAESKPSNVTCNGGSNTCLHGSCTGSICALYETTECECYQNKDEMCHVCCNNSQGECVSAQEFLGRVVLKPSGSTCKSHQGYCDSYGVCVIVDNESELNKLRDTFRGFFAKTAMSDITNWIKRH